MLSFNIFNKRNFLFFYLIFELLKNIVKCSAEFIDIKKVTIYDSTYFVVLDTGLYLYNFNTFDCALIHKFNNSVYKNNPNNKFNITELTDKYNYFIFCLVNEYLFIFNAHNNKTFSYKINEYINTFSNGYYNLMPYKFENNNISFILVCNNERT